MDRKTLNATIDEDQIMVVVTASTDFTQFHVQLSSENAMTIDDIIDCLQNFNECLADQGEAFFEGADHVGEIN